MEWRAANEPFLVVNVRFLCEWMNDGAAVIDLLGVRLILLTPILP